MKKARKSLFLSMFFLSLLVVAPTIQSCKRNPSRQYKGKIKRGKPIPCPVKDC